MDLDEIYMELQEEWEQDFWERNKREPTKEETRKFQGEELQLRVSDRLSSLVDAAQDLYGE